jgi:hypothetical protein
MGRPFCISVVLGFYDSDFVMTRTAGDHKASVASAFVCVLAFVHIAAQFAERPAEHTAQFWEVLRPEDQQNDH